VPAISDEQIWGHLWFVTDASVPKGWVIVSCTSFDRNKENTL